jgi:uncharacterized protein with PQ loop repeat
MARMGGGIHHLHKRIRVHEQLQEFPHPNKWINRLDKLLLVIAAIGPIMNIPQAIQIFATKNASGLSLLSYASFTFFDIFWLTYGIVHKEKPIILAYTLWLVTNIVVVSGIIIYG